MSWWQRVRDRLHPRTTTSIRTSPFPHLPRVSVQGRVLAGTTVTLAMPALWPQTAPLVVATAPIPRTDIVVHVPPPAPFHLSAAILREGEDP